MTVLMSDAPRATRAPFDVAVATSAAFFVLILIWAGFDTRAYLEAPVWLKPAKFAMSFVVHFATLALIVRAMSPDRRSGRSSGRVLVVTEAVMVTAFLTEMIYITYQAARAEGSHYNIGDPFHAAMYGVMGLGAVLLVVGPVAVAAVAWRDTVFGPATRVGLVAGAVVSCILTLIVAGTLSGLESHFVGVPAPGAATIPLLGWSAAVGDLRPAHFMSLHALQVLPLVGLWADRTGRAGRVVFAVAVIWTAITMALFAQAMMGLPLIRL